MISLLVVVGVVVVVFGVGIDIGVGGSNDVSGGVVFNK